jgi:hypothetical protein
MTAAAMAETAADAREARRSGHTTITAATMRKMVEAVGAESFGVPASAVRASLSDERGQLCVSLALPLVVPALAAAARNPQLVADDGGTLFQRAATARGEIIRRTRELAGTTVGRVNINLTGIRNGTEARVQ